MPPCDVPRAVRSNTVLYYLCKRLFRYAFQSETERSDWIGVTNSLASTRKIPVLRSSSQTRFKDENSVHKSPNRVGSPSPVPPRPPSQAPFPRTLPTQPYE